MSEYTLTDEKINFGDLEIFLLKDENSEKYTKRDDVFYMAKSTPYISSYSKIKSELAGGRAGNVLEIGIYRGGSAPFLHRFFDAEQVVCIDLMKDPAIPLENYKQQNPDVIRTYYGVNQADRVVMSEILELEFATPIDLVVDDGSHFYAETKAAFESVFPYMTSGGIYVIENWSWAHVPWAQQPNHIWADRHALTNLIFELIMVHADSGIIDRIAFGPGMMWVSRGWKILPKQGFYLNDYVLKRGRSLSLI